MENRRERNKETEQIEGSESPLGRHSFSSSSFDSEIDPCDWVQGQIIKGTDPKKVLKELLHQSCRLPEHLDDVTLWRLVLQLLTDPKPRPKLPHVNTIEDVMQLIVSSSRIIVLSGAGISVSCGIPDFRSRDGLYARLAQDFPELPDPQAIFDIHYFRDDPQPFFRFAKELFPGQYKPSISHKFIAMLEKRGKLLRNYTQNIDTLEASAGITRVVFCHGSFSTATCCSCGHKVKGEELKDDILKEHVPLCSKCNNDEPGVMKPDIVFFGEGLPELFHSQLQSDKLEADLLIVMGSSLKVQPVSLIPNVLPCHVPQILINCEPLSHLNFDVELLGFSDGIIAYLCDHLGPDWVADVGCSTSEQRPIVTKSLGPSTYIFPGASTYQGSTDDEGSDDGEVEQRKKKPKLEQQSSSKPEDMLQTETCRTFPHGLNETSSKRSLKEKTSSLHQACV